MPPPASPRNPAGMETPMPQKCSRQVLLLLPVLVMVGIVFLLAMDSAAWHQVGHAQATKQALAILPESLPAFFREGEATILTSSSDPDLFTKPIAPPMLHAAEAPDHYFDCEILEGVDLPADRYAFLKIVYARGLEPSKVGLLPYSITEWTGRLQCAFAEYRAWPDDKAIQAKCLLYAGVLAHYAEDLCNPLHTTIHYDGRIQADGSKSGKGIHLRLDALIQKTPPVPAEALPERIEAYDDVFAGVMEAFRVSHALVDWVYELDGNIPSLDDPVPANSPAVEFAQERKAAAIAFTARLFLTAWQNSAKITLPKWYVHPGSTAWSQDPEPAR